MDVEYTEAFLRQLRRLGRRYRHIRDDVQPVIEQLQAGETPGDQIPDVGLTLFKVRVRNRDIQKGKSAGYRLIYYLKTQDKIILVTMSYRTAGITLLLANTDLNAQRSTTE